METIFEWASHDRLPVVALTFEERSLAWMQKIGFNVVWNGQSTAGKHNLNMWTVARQPETPLPKISFRSCVEIPHLHNSNNNNNEKRASHTLQKVEGAEGKKDSDFGFTDL